MDQAQKTQETRLRRMAARQGLRLTRSRRRDPHASDYGTYRLIPESGLFAAPGDGMLRGLDEVEEWLTDTLRDCAHCGRRARGFARDACGNRLCHGDTGPDCYRRVTVYGEPLGILKAHGAYPDGISNIAPHAREVPESPETGPSQLWLPDWTIPPGDILLDCLEMHGMTRTVLAQRAGCTKRLISDIIDRQHPISPAVAAALRRVLGIPPRFWLSLDRAYRADLVRLGRAVHVCSLCGHALEDGHAQGCDGQGETVVYDHDEWRKRTDAR